MMMSAPGGPGLAPTWTSSAKDMVGTALGPSRLWFTTGFGIVNEVYYPRVDSPQIRDLGFIVADGEGFWVEVKRHGDYVLTTPAPGIPAVQILHRHPRFELRLRIVPDPDRDALLIEACLSGDAGLKLYALLAPHLGSTGNDNIAAVFENRGVLVPCAEQGGYALALAAVDADTHRPAWSRASAGYVGASDGWQDFAQHGAMRWTYAQAGPGNVALLAEASGQEVTLALAFGRDKEAAATLALSALLRPFEQVWQQNVAAWTEWQERSVASIDVAPEYRAALHVAAMVLRTHQDKTFPGAMVASLSIPWGNSNNDTGGYHLVWPRDLVESAGALLALGARREPRDILRYLIASQLAEGHWAQNQWLSGEPRWTGVQLDEVALPVLLAAALAREGALQGIVIQHMVRRALRFIVLNGPGTDQDRWEETPGINAFTVAVAIAALVAGADLLDIAERHDLLLIADDWNANIENWLVAADPHICARHGVTRYYARSVPVRIVADPGAIDDRVPVRNQPESVEVPASTMVSTDFLQLVRFGLRAPNDPVILDTIRLTDAMLRAETPSGPAWYRYNLDGYGEHADGHAFDGTGTGRPWPLLTGERGHYEVCAGNPAEAKRLIAAMLAMTGRAGLLPEQVWDDAPIPAANLHPGRPSGSAMPLVWAHGELVKLVLSLANEKPVDRPEAVWLRYAGKRPQAARAHWSRHMPVATIRADQSLRLLFDRPTIVRWRALNATAETDVPTIATALDIHVVDIAAATLANTPGISFACLAADRSIWLEQEILVKP